MLRFVLAAALPLHPFDLVRVEDPDHPGADARSATGAVLLEPPPPGTPWSWELVPEVDLVESEAVEALNADLWHQGGIGGAGVRVAVFDPQWFGAEVDPDELGTVSTWDCYAHPACTVPIDTWNPRFGWEEGVHGFACAEVIHDIAPEAELHLVRVNGRTALENAVSWAIREDIDLISMSLSFFNSSFYDGTGAVSRPMGRLREADVLLATSSGNYARSHWHGSFVDADLDGRMDFDGDGGLWIRLAAGSSRPIYIAWNQFRTCGATDLDAVLYDAEGWIVGRSESRQDVDGDRCEPVERLRGYVEADGWYWLELIHRRGEVAGVEVDITARGATVSGAVPEYSIADPGVSPDVLTVAAVSVHGYLDNDVESFSSWGPTVAGVAKPDLAGPDGLSTAAYGPRGFYGTSASTPAVVGALALVMSEDPSLSPFEAARQLQGWSLGDDPLWEAPDPRWGAGKARLPLLDPEAPGCGRRRLLLPLFLLPLGWFRRRGALRIRRARGHHPSDPPGRHEVRP